MDASSRCILRPCDKLPLRACIPFTHYLSSSVKVTVFFRRIFIRDRVGYQFQRLFRGGNDVLDSLYDEEYESRAINIEVLAQDDYFL